MNLIRSHLLRWQIIGLFGAALLIRLFMAPFPGYWGDTNLLVQYARVAAQKGLLGVNQIEISVLYPVGYLYHSDVVGHVLKHKLRDASTYPTEGMTPGGASAIERLGVRVIPIAYDMLIAAALLLIVSRYISARAGIWGAAIYLFNPGVIVSSAIWNYDAVPSFYQLVAVVLAGLALRNRRDVFWMLSWAAAGLAFTMKAQAGMVVPILAVMTLFSGRWKSVVLAPVVFFGVVAVMFFPFIVGHQAVYLRRAYLDSFDAYPVTHVGAYNLWALWFQRPVTDRVAGITYETLGRCMFLASMAWLTWCIWAQKAADGARALARVGVVFTYAFAAPFVLLTRMHERYFAPTVAVAILAGLFDRRLRGCMWGFCAGFAINMLTILTQTFLRSDNADVTQAMHIGFGIIRFFCCALIVGVFFWLTWKLPMLLKPIEPAAEAPVESQAPPACTV